MVTNLLKKGIKINGNRIVELLQHQVTILLNNEIKIKGNRLPKY